MEFNKGENYKALLVIRKTAMQRNTAIIGTIFLVSFLALIAFGLLDKLTSRSVYIIVGLVVCFGVGYLTSLIKLEILKNSIDLMDHI